MTTTNDSRRCFEYDATSLDNQQHARLHFISFISGDTIMTDSKEQFRQDMIRWLESQDRNGDFSDSEAAAQGGRPITVEDGITHATEWAMGDVTVDVKAGRVPITVRSFSQLHDYVDANGYGGAFDWPCLPSAQRD